MYIQRHKSLRIMVYYAWTADAREHSEISPVFIPPICLFYFLETVQVIIFKLCTFVDSKIKFVLLSCQNVARLSIILKVLQVLT